MDLGEKSYRQTVNNIAFSMLLLAACLELFPFVLELCAVLTLPLGTVATTLISEGVGALCYVLAFLFPVLFFFALTAKTGREPIRTEWRLSPTTPLLIFFGIAVTLAAAEINARIVDVFHFAPITEDMGVVRATTHYEAVLLFLTVAVIPGFFEELLFRGVVLSNLLPFGRTTAVIASALLFGLMHQTLSQVFYATAAGIVLGLVYVHTNSIWPGVLIHLCNNFYSTLRSLIWERLPQETAYLVFSGINLAVVLLGVVSLVLLLITQKDHIAALRRVGCFERAIPPDPDYARISLPFSTRLRSFFSIPMIIFVVICVLFVLSDMGTHLLFSMFGGIFS